MIMKFEEFKNILNKQIFEESSNFEFELTIDYKNKDYNYYY